MFKEAKTDFLERNLKVAVAVILDSIMKFKFAHKFFVFQVSLYLGVVVKSCL